MVPKSQKWPTFLTTCPYKAEQFTLNLWQSYDSILARGPGKAHLRQRHGITPIECLMEMFQENLTSGKKGVALMGDIPEGR